MAYGPKKTAPSESSAGSATAALAENRKEERYGADGQVRLILDHDGSKAVSGRLADVSQSGFRVHHQYRDLRPGRVLRFDYEDRESGKQKSGWARVIWSRVLDSQVETGCFIVIAD